MSEFNPTRKDHQNGASGRKDFASLLRERLDRKIQMGRNGIDLNAGKKGEVQYLVYREFWMSDEVFDLGCAMHRAGSLPTNDLWVSWMNNTKIVVGDDKVTVLSPNQFYKDYAEKNLGQRLNEYFKKPILFQADLGNNTH